MPTWSAISAVTTNGRMNTCRMYILMIVGWPRLNPPNSIWAPHSPTIGTESDILTPIWPAQKASWFHGSRYPV